MTLALLAMVTLQTNDLTRFVNLKDSAYRASISRSNSEISMTSQRWKGTDWKHVITTNVPKGRLRSSSTAILVITGDRVEPADGNYAQALADKSGLRVFTLFDIPNQPIWGKREDDLIAFTYQQFLETGDTDWPLLFPMTKAARKAMDAIQESSPTPPTKFIVTGASKRGWTTWLLAACRDKRVTAIAPAVFDNLAFDRQLERQKFLWGEYSEMIADYARRGLLEVLKTPRGSQLLKMVDPWSYRNETSIPKLLITGSNDRYWPTDATSIYLRDLVGPTSSFVAANKGHNTAGLEISTLAAFARSIALSLKWPELKWASVTSSTTTWRTSQTRKQRLWVAVSDTKDFRESRWVATELGQNVRSLRVPTLAKHCAAFVEAEYELDGMRFSLCTERRIVR